MFGIGEYYHMEVENPGGFQGFVENPTKVLQNWWNRMKNTGMNIMTGNNRSSRLNPGIIT